MNNIRTFQLGILKGLRMLIWYRLVNLKPDDMTKFIKLNSLMKDNIPNNWVVILTDGLRSFAVYIIKSLSYKIYYSDRFLVATLERIAKQIIYVCMFAYLNFNPQREPRVWYVYIQIFETKCVKTICKYYSSVNRR